MNRRQLLARVLLAPLGLSLAAKAAPVVPMPVMVELDPWPGAPTLWTNANTGNWEYVAADGSVLDQGTRQDSNQRWESAIKLVYQKKIGGDCS